MAEKVDTHKQKEWRSIKNIIPCIEKYLHLENIFNAEIFEKERPDFVFFNASMSVGVEVTECHPSVQKNRKRNYPSINAHKERICKMFMRNEYLASITRDRKLNILIDSGFDFNFTSKPEDVCKSLEGHLRAWLKKDKYDDCRLIKRIRVYETVGKNIVYFNAGACRRPIHCQDLAKCIAEKNRKFSEYKKKQCDENWLCIYLPFEENRQSNRIEIENYNAFENFIQESPYDRIVVTSVMDKDINWLKGEVCYVNKK